MCLVRNFDAFWKYLYFEVLHESIKNRYKGEGILMVRIRGLEPPRACAH